MAVTIRYFAWVRELCGCDEEQLDLPQSVQTATHLAAHLGQRGGGYAQAFGNPEKLRCAVDMVMVPLDQPMGDAKEIAFFPPVTGG
jgi:sulfur-carrier protein